MRPGPAGRANPGLRPRCLLAFPIARPSRTMVCTDTRPSRNSTMPAKNHDLHGNVPDSAEAALLLIDVINDLEFEGSQPLAEQVISTAEHIAALKRRAQQAGIPVIY